MAAVIVEGIQGIGGIHLPEGDFLREIQALCHAPDTIFILDEIQSGYGRSGKFFAFQHHAGVEPDLITMAKGMGNGFPIGGVLIHPKFKAKHGLLGTTFGGSHLACSAGIAVLDVLKDENLMENARIVGNYALKQLATIEGIKEVRGIGLMLAVEFPFSTAALRKRMAFDEKCFVGSSSEANTIRLLPPLCVTKEDVDTLVASLKAAVSKELVAA